MKPTCLCSSLLRLSASWSWLSSSMSGAAGAASAAGARLAGCVCDTEPCNKHSVDIRAKKKKDLGTLSHGMQLYTIKQRRQNSLPRLHSRVRVFLRGLG